MNYEAMIRETDELVRRVMLHNEVSTWLLACVGVALMFALAWFAWTEHREKMRQMRTQREWEEMQVAMNEPYYRRMG